MTAAEHPPKDASNASLKQSDMGAQAKPDHAQSGNTKSNNAQAKSARSKSTPSEPKPNQNGLRLKSRFARWLLNRFGHRRFSTLHRMGTFFGSLLYGLHLPVRHTVETNLSLACPDWPPEKRQRITKQTLIDNCKLTLELAFLWTRPAADGKQLIRHIHGEDIFDRALADPRGLLLILPHLGNWELTNHYLMAKTPLTALYKPVSLPDVETQVKQARSLGETHMVPTNQSGVKELMRTLKKGGVSVILPDQSPPSGSGQFAPLFGVPAYTSPLVPKLLNKTKAQCLCIFAERLPNAEGFDIYIEPAAPQIFDDNAAQALAGLNASVENCIRPRMSQYLWSYKRYKIRPDNAPNPYDFPKQAKIARAN